LSRDAALFNARYASTMGEIKKLIAEAEVAPNKDNQNMSPSYTMTAREAAFFANPKLHHFCDEITNHFNRLKEATARVPSYDAPEDSISKKIVYQRKPTPKKKAITKKKSMVFCSVILSCFTVILA
jgi:hypothetical protein